MAFEMGKNTAIGVTNQHDGSPPAANSYLELMMEDLPTDKHQLVVKLTPKLEDAAQTQSGITLLALEALFLAELCKFPLYPNLRTEDTEMFQVSLRTAAQFEETKLCARDAATCWFAFRHSRFYAPTVERSVEDDFNRLLSRYMKYNPDRTHCLDHMRNLGKGYSVYLASIPTEMYARLQRASPDEREKYTQRFFFCAVHCLERLGAAEFVDDHLEINHKEANVMLIVHTESIGDVSLSDEASSDPNIMTAQKLIAAVGCVSSTKLTREDVACLRESCKSVPFPKPRPAIDSSIEARIPQFGGSRGQQMHFDLPLPDFGSNKTTLPHSPSDSVALNRMGRKVKEAQYAGMSVLLSAPELIALERICAMSQGQFPPHEDTFDNSEQPLVNFMTKLHNAITEDLPELMLDVKDIDLISKLLHAAASTFDYVDFTSTMSFEKTIGKHQARYSWDPPYPLANTCDAAVVDAPLNAIWKRMAHKSDTAAQATGTTPAPAAFVHFTHLDAKLLKSKVLSLEEALAIARTNAQGLFTCNMKHGIEVEEKQAIIELYQDKMQEILHALEVNLHQFYTHSSRDLQPDKEILARIAAHRDVLAAELSLRKQEKELLIVCNRRLCLALKPAQDQDVKIHKMYFTPLYWDTFPTHLEQLKLSIARAAVSVDEVKVQVGEMDNYQFIRKDPGSGHDFMIESSPVANTFEEHTKDQPVRTRTNKTSKGEADWVYRPTAEIALSTHKVKAATETQQELEAMCMNHAVARASAEEKAYKSQIGADYYESHLRAMATTVSSFAESVQALFPELHARFKASQHGTQTFAIMKHGIESVIKQNKSLTKKLNASFSDQQSKMDELRKDQTEFLKKSKDDISKPFLKKLAIKDKEMSEKETELKNVRESHHNREEALKNETRKVESNLAAMKERLEKALKEPDKVRAEFFQKIQRLYEKVSKGEQKLKAEVEAHDITKLDSAATMKDHDALKAKITRFREQHEQFMTKTAEVIKERDELQASRVTEAQHHDMDASKISRAVEEAVRPLEATISKLKVDKQKTEKSREAVAAMQELSELKLKYSEQSKEMGKMKETLTVLEDVPVAVTREKDELAEQLKEGKEKSAMMKQSGKTKALQNQLDAEKARSKQLEEQLAEYQSLATMFQSIKKS